MTSTSCSWCHCPVPTTEPRCPVCGHDTGPRISCRCPRCADTRRLTAADGQPVPLADVVGAVLAALHQSAPREDTPGGPGPTDPEQENAMKTRDEKPGASPALVTREVARTPVSARLADLIRRLDEALVEEFGPVWFAYAIMGGDGLVAASNARDGYAPPVVAPAPPTDPT